MTQIVQTLTEKHKIKKSNPYYNLVDSLMHASKNLFNLALYHERQIFFEYRDGLRGVSHINYYELNEALKSSEAYRSLPTGISQQILRQVASTFNTSLKLIFDYQKNPSKYTGRPKLPRYKSKQTGRYPLTLPYTMFRYKASKEKIALHKAFQGLEFKPGIDPSDSNIKLTQLSFHHKPGYIEVTLTYDRTIEVDTTNLKLSAGIDIGIDNFSTITIWNQGVVPVILNGKGLKSYNKQFNKLLAEMKSKATKHGLRTTKRIQRLYERRNNYFRNQMHQMSRYTINYLQSQGVRHLYVGYNKDWKRDSPLSKRVNQTFIQIPYMDYIHQLQYKGRAVGIQVHIVEESYTSGTSFLDNEMPTRDSYDKSRRIHRGLFRTNTGRLVNADVNASYQIQKKRNPSEMNFTKVPFYDDGLGLRLTPQRVNVA